MDRRIKHWCIHLLRLAMLAAILGLMHWQYERLHTSKTNGTRSSISIEDVQRLFPIAVRIEDRNNLDQQWVLDKYGTRLGYVIQTAPESDTFLGFSGPTNLLIAFHPDDRIMAVEILDSRDTRDHVALIRNHPSFLSSWQGRTSDEAASRRSVDGVAGATLTSFAIVQGIQRRLGASSVLAKFSEPLTNADAKPFFPNGYRMEVDRVIESLWHVKDENGTAIGSILRTSPAADSIVGYQGPTEARIAMDMKGHTVGISIAGTFDNEPYVGYVRSDAGFAELLSRYSIEQWSELDLKQQGIEGVSGATMTSMAIAESIIVTAKKFQGDRQKSDVDAQQFRSFAWRSIGTILMVAMGIVIGLTRLRGNAHLRVGFQILLILFLGLMHGDLLSMAMWVGWAQCGVPWQNAIGLVVLSIAAIAIPIGTKTNVYCSHLCPHGAVQQLLPRRWKIRQSIGPKTLAILRSIRPLLLIWVLSVGILCLPFSLVDIEPFDAYVWRAAAWPTFIVFAVGVLVSIRIPMAYCRFGCPTGAILNYVRRNAKSDRWTRADSFAASCLAVGCCISLWTIPFVLSVHDPDSKSVHIHGRAFGTAYSLRYRARELLPTQNAVMSIMDVELKRLDSIFSRYRSDSEIELLNRSPAGRWIEVSTDLMEVLLFSKQLAESTQGAFDPTVGQVFQLWQRKPMANWSPPSEDSISQSMQSVGYQKIELDPQSRSIRKSSSHVQVDLNALAEGWAIDRIVRLLEAAGLTDFLFELGGEFAARGHGSQGDGWIVGIEDPNDPIQIHSKVILRNEALCNSGTYRQTRTHAGKSYSHILDARTGRPVEHELCSVSVVHPSALVGDGWATSLLILGPGEGKRLANERLLDARFIE